MLKANIYTQIYIQIYVPKYIYTIIYTQIHVPKYIYPNIYFHIHICCRLSEKSCLRKIRWRVMEKDSRYTPVCHEHTHVSLSHTGPHCISPRSRKIRK